MRSIIKFGFLLAALTVIACKNQNKPLFRLIGPDDSGITFRNDLIETEERNVINLEYFYNGGGVVVGDFNNDGLNDLFFTGNNVSNKLFLNKGNLSFEDVTDKSGVDLGGRWKSGATLVDINEDGWMDIYVCATISTDSVGRRNMMLVNQGLTQDGVPRFVNKAAGRGLKIKGIVQMRFFLIMIRMVTWICLYFRIVGNVDP